MRTPWREMTEEQKARERIRQKLYRAKPEVKAKERMRKKLWKQNNKDKVRASERRRYMRTKADDERMANRAARIATWRENNKERYGAMQRKALKAWRTKRRLRFARDSKAYSAHRERHREYCRMKCEREGREYKPRMSMRIPDWCVFGQCEAEARRSSFLREHMSSVRIREIDGYARELAIERRNWQTARNVV